MPHVAVAGAGIGGLAAALALARAGCRVSIVERAPALLEIGAGLQLSPNATAALRRLGVLDRVERTAVALEALEIRRGRDGATLARMDLGAGTLRRFGAPFLVTLRADLQRALQEAVAEADGIVLRTGAALTGWTSGTYGVDLQVAGEAPTPLVADGLIGADGLRSTVRRQLWGDTAPEPARRSAWRATIDAEAVPAMFRMPRSQLWLGAGAHLVHYPVAAGRLINVVAALDGPMPLDERLNAPWSRPGDPAEIVRRFAGWTAPVRALVAAAPAWGQWPLVDRPALPRWSKGAVTLVGDAAHPMLPFLAQGAAQALEDAVALADAVAASRDDLPAAFAAYDEARRPRATRVQRESRRQGLVYHLPWPASLARDLVLRSTPSARLLGRYAWLYGS
jgi:salicylate hydroxylase